MESFFFKINDEGHVTHLYMIGGETVWFDSVPEQISELTYLKELNLSCNQIEVLPESIGQLKYLKKLNLWGNRLQEIPKFLLKLSFSGGVQIDLDGNDDIPEKNLKDFYSTIKS